MASGKGDSPGKAKFWVKMEVRSVPSVLATIALENRHCDTGNGLRNRTVMRTFRDVAKFHDELSREVT